jgi:CRISPR-associated protein Cas1
MPVFERPPLETLTPARERWTPLYLEHGRLEVDDASVKWIGSDRTILRIPVATVSVLMLGPGTTVTHAAMKACAESNTPVCWVGADGLRFYAFGVSPTHDTERARRQAEQAMSKTRRVEVARRMFRRRFPAEIVDQTSLLDLRGMEGKRVKALYGELGAKYGVTWKGRQYDQTNWQLADGINRALSATNAALYALTTAVVSSMGYLPALGFVHSDGPLAFVYDVADLYKHETSFPAAFQCLAANPEADEKDALAMLKTKIEETRLMARMPKDLEELFA